MTKSEDATSGTTVANTKTSTEYKKGQTRISSGWGGRGGRGNASKDNKEFASSTTKYYKGETESFGAVLALKCEKI